MFFLNQTKLAVVEDSIVKTDTLQNEINRTLDDLEDTFTDLSFDSVRLKIQIDSGDTSLIPEWEEVSEDLDSVRTDIDEYEYMDSVNRAHKKVLTSTETAINEGEVKILSITNRINGQSVSYEDSSAQWYLPLSMNEDNVYTRVEVEGDTTGNIDLVYEREITVNEFNNVIVEAYNVSLLGYTGFDTVFLDCETCEANETTLEIRF